MRTAEEVTASAARLCAVHPLRAYDAVQLASALVVQELQPDDVPLAAFDRALRRAAAAEGLRLLPETSPAL